MSTENKLFNHFAHFLKPFLIMVVVGIVLGRDMLDIGNIAMAVVISIGLGMFFRGKEYNK